MTSRSGGGPAVLRAAGEGGQLPDRNVSGLCQPLERALANKRLYLPESWTSDSGRCESAGAPADRRRYRSKTQLAPEMLQWALDRGHLKVVWVAGDDDFGMSPSFRHGLTAQGMRYVLDVPGGTTV